MSVSRVPSRVVSERALCLRTLHHCAVDRTDRADCHQLLRWDFQLAVQWAVQLGCWLVEGLDASHTGRGTTCPIASASSPPDQALRQPGETISAARAAEGQNGSAAPLFG